jgi:hypothetical protein
MAAHMVRKKTSLRNGIKYSGDAANRLVTGYPEIHHTTSPQPDENEGYRLKYATTSNGYQRRCIDNALSF